MAATDTTPTSPHAASAAAGTAGGWPRSRHDLEREWAYVQLLGEVVAAKSAGLDASQLDPNARALLGIRAAAAWSLGHTTTTPITRRQGPASFWPATDEIDAADAVLKAHAPGWDYAVGVLRWLSWLIEAEDEVRYPPL